MVKFCSNKGPLRKIVINIEPPKEIQEEMLNFLTSYNVHKEDQIKIFLVRLAYILNSEWKFDEKVKEQLFFGITKFLFHYNPFLRRLIFTIINMLDMREHKYVIFQSLIRDLTSNNQYVRQYALQFIPTLCDETQILQVEQYITNALQYKQLSDHAMILGLKLFKRYPNFITNLYSAIIIQRLDQSIIESKQHALNLIHEITNTVSFCKIIIELKTQELTSLVKQQLMKYIKEVLIQNQFHSAYKIELQQYLLQQMYYSESIIFFEAVGVVIQIDEIKNEQLQPMMKFMMNYLNSIVSNIETYSALKLLKQLISYRLNLIQDEHISLIEKLTFSPHISISSSAIFICIQYQLINSNLTFAEYLQQLYQSSGQSIEYNFIQGILELVHIYHFKGDQIIKFLYLTTLQNCPVQLANILFEISEQIFFTQFVNLIEAIQMFFWIAQSHNTKIKLKVINYVHKYWIPIPKDSKFDTDIEIFEHFNILQSVIFPKLNHRFGKLNILFF